MSSNMRSQGLTASGDVANDLSDGYPIFSDGDVLIISSTGRQWKLHSATILRHSRVLRELISEEVAPGPSKRRKTTALGGVKWKILMVEWEKDPKLRNFRSFELIDLSAQQFVFPELDNGNGPETRPYNKIYDNLFRCMYNLEPKFTAGEKIKKHINEATALLQAAEYLDAGRSVSLPIEASFLRLGQRLFKHIALNSAAWCDISLRLQSATIFRAAMAQVAGRFDLPGIDGINQDFLKSLPNGPMLMEFAAKRADILMDQKLRIERDLLSFFPNRMRHPEIDGVAPTREAYTNDIYMWQALTIVRQWIMSAYMANMHHTSIDGGTRLYQQIHAGGEAYLRKELVENFHEICAMSAKGKECLRTAMYFLKEDLKHFVAPLMADHSGIWRAPEESKPRYLVCVEVKDEEMPWMVGKEPEGGYIEASD